MIKTILIFIFIFVILWLFKNKLPEIRNKLKILVNNPFFRSIALRGLLRLVRFLIFRR